MAAAKRTKDEYDRLLAELTREASPERQNRGFAYAQKLPPLLVPREIRTSARFGLEHIKVGDVYETRIYFDPSIQSPRENEGAIYPAEELERLFPLFRNGTLKSGQEHFSLGSSNLRHHIIPFRHRSFRLPMKNVPNCLRRFYFKYELWVPR